MSTITTTTSRPRLMAMSLAAIALVSLTYWGCIPPRPPEVYREVTVDFRDTIFQRIQSLQDERLTDSLYAYFRHPNPTYRYLAALALGSIQDSTALDSLGSLLQDPFDEVRAAAAYAIGQIGSAAGAPLLMKNFVATDTAGVFQRTNRAILEAVGKCGDVKTLDLLASITTYKATDTSLLDGQAWGIYRLGLRGITSQAGQKRMISWATKAAFPPDTRLAAVSYLSRVNQPIDSLQAAPLAAAFEAERDANLRMGLALALGKTKAPDALAALVRQYGRESDYRVKINMLRAFGNFPYEQCRETVLLALRDPNLHIARRAAAYFIDQGLPADATLYWRFAKDSLPSLVQLDLYTAANKHLPAYFADYRDAINSEIRQRFAKSSNPVEKAVALRALAEFGWNLRFIQREAFASQQPLVRVAGIEALTAISESPKFAKFFGLSSRKITKELSIYFQQAIATGDPGMISPAAIALRFAGRNYASTIDSFAVLENALAKLSLPKEIEAYNDLATTLALLQGKPAYVPEKPEYTHPPQWAVLNKFAAAPKVSISTNAGVIVLELWPDLAPATVINFVELARSGYYNGKNFHRVVSNFVIQGGCPRGDGYGSLDYSIRSELPDVYYHQPGIIGMASAGLDTEGVQFFITHSPTPHLDGRYTAFGQVIEGMDVVHRIQVGDKINKITID